MTDTASAVLPRGLLAPILTPFDDDGAVVHDLYVDHARRMLDQGCGGLVPFGTTGEALSLSVDERMAGLEALIADGIDPALMIPGTGVANLHETVALSAHALDRGCAAVMVLPPFYYPDPGDDGLVAYAERLLGAVGDWARIVLYHIPAVAGVGWPLAVVARLRAEHPDRIVGIKDSTGVRADTLALFDVPGLAVYPGTEALLADALERGGPGCISAMANVDAPRIVEAIRRHADDGDGGDGGDASGIREALRGLDTIAALKHMVAERTGDARWRNVRPPLEPLSADVADLLATRITG